MDPNALTIASYEDGVQDYINGSDQHIEHEIKHWIDTALLDLSAASVILEIGSASGRDAAYIQDRGYSIECTDATLGFVRVLRKKGFEAHQLNIILDELKELYDLILANAVLVHFTRQETRDVITKIYNALNTGGRFAFSVLSSNNNEEERWSNNKVGAPRYFCFWTQKDIDSVLREAGFLYIDIKKGKSGQTTTWLQIIAYKGA